MIKTIASPTNLKIEDRVYLIRDITYIGTIKIIEDNKLSVMIQWDDCDGLDFQWSNKIRLL